MHRTVVSEIVTPTKTHFDCNVKFAPTGLCELIWRFAETAQWIGEAVMKFELDSPHVGGHVLVGVKRPKECCP